jgi:hypothetical protein
MEIELQDGTVLDAPDGLSPEQIKSLVVNYTRNQWGVTDRIGNTVNQLGTGVYKGLANVAGLPGTLADAGAAAGMPQKYGGMGGAPNPTAPTGNNSLLPSGTGVQDFMKNQLGIPLVDPETTGDRYLQAAGTGLSGAFLPGGVLPNAVGGTVGAVSSEAAGDLAAGTEYENAARLLGALIPGFGASALTNRLAASNVEQIISRATMGATPQQWRAAERLQAEALTRGTPLTSAEAMAQVQGGNQSLMSIQRNVENMRETAPQMNTFMAQRPQGNAAATEAQLSQVAPRPVAPTEIGPRIRQGAEDYVSGIRQDINTETEPLYWLSQFDRMPQGEFARISQQPAFQIALRNVRADELLGPRIAHMPDDSIAVINAVKKEMDEMGAQFGTYGTEAYSPTRQAAVEGGRAPTVEAATNASPAYGQALETQATRRTAELLPAERAPIGQLAKTEDATEQARILLPDSALKASPEQIGGTVRELVNQGRTADVQSLLRGHLQDVFAKSASNVKGAGEQYRGAQFANNVLKNPNQVAALESAVRALPDGDTQWQGMRNLLEVFEAQGQRLPANSPTSFNQQLRSDMAQNLGKGVKSFGTDMWANWNVERRSAELARILTAPEGVALLRQLAVTGPRTARAQQLVQAFYQGGQGSQKALEQRAVP